jgi:hypothetical protein
MQCGAETLFYSDRYFVVSTYVHSHGMLLFRSAKGRQGAQTQVDVLFQDVRAAELRFWSSGLSVQESSFDNIASAACNPLGMNEPGLRVYSLHGEGWSGFVVAGVHSSMEYDGEVSATSPLLDLHGSPTSA